MKRHTPRAVAALVGMVLSWASIPLFLKHFALSLDAWTVNGIRYGAAALALVPLLRMPGRTDPPGRNIWRDALVPGTINSVGQVGWALLPYFMPASVMGFGVRSAFLFTLLGSLWLLPEERYLFRSPAFWGGAGVCVAGFVVLFRATARDPSASIGGLFVLLATSAVWGFYGVTVRKFMKGYAPERGFAVISLYTAAVVSLLMLILGDMREVASQSPATMGLLLFSALLGISVAHVLMFYVLSHLGAVIEGGAEMATPFLTFIGAALLFGERLSPIQWAGGIGVVAGCLLMIRAHR
jgi:drug/metabolite transporter (DMT)-like permease